MRQRRYSRSKFFYCVAAGWYVDTFTIAAGVYENYEELNKRIAWTRSALALIPNDLGCFITINLVLRLKKAG